MRGKRIFIALAVAGATFGIATAVQAAIPDSAGIVTACYQFSPPNNQQGVMRAIDAEGGQFCRFYEHQIELATPQYVLNQIAASNAADEAADAAADAVFMALGPNVTVAAGNPGNATVSCPNGMVAVSGGTVNNPAGPAANVQLQDFAPTNMIGNSAAPSQQFDAEFQNETAATQNVKAWAECIPSTNVTGGNAPALAPHATPNPR
jgi:hypothetical protein